MDSLLLWLGTLACGLGAAGALLPLAPRRRIALVGFALLLAPLLVAGDNWDSDRFVQLRESPALLLAAGLGLGLGAALGARFLLARPRWLAPLLVGVMAIRIPVELGGSSANLLLPLYGVLAAGLIAAWLDPQRLMPRPPPQSGLLSWVGPVLAAFVVAYAAQAAYADDLSTAVENLSFFLAPFAALFLLLGAAPWDRRLLRTTLLVLAAEALLVSVVGFGQAITGELLWNQKVIDGNEAHPYFRVNSLFFDPNIMGRYLAITMVLLGGVVAWGARRDGLRAAAVFVVLLVGLAFTFSQTSILALLAGLGMLALAVWGLPRALLTAAALLAALALAVFGLGGGGLTAETTGRTGLVSGGLEIAADRPLTGYGSGSFADEFEGRFGGGDGIAVISHTEPVTVAAEQGALGLLPYAAVVAVGLLALWPSAGLGRDPLAATILAAFVAILVHSFGYAAFFTDPITWALLALGTAIGAGRALAKPGAERC